MTERYEDKMLTCMTCGAEFLWSATAQQKFAEWGYVPPKRCPSCRPQRRDQR